MHYIQIPTTASYYKYSFFPLVIVQWNELPAQVLFIQPSSLHAIDHETLFSAALNFFSN